MTRACGPPETLREKKGLKQNSNGKPNNWGTNLSQSNPRLHDHSARRVPWKYFERNARRKNGREGQRKDRYTGKEKTKEEKMTVAELMHHNFDEIFIELDPVKREAMMRNAYTEDCVWIHPGGRL